jgi:chromosome partitioning protein
MYESSTRLAAEVSRDVEEFLQASASQSPVWASAKFFQTKIRRNIRIAEAPSFGQSIFDYAPNSHGSEDYLNLAKEVLATSSSNTKICPPIATSSPSVVFSSPTI